LVLNRNWMPIRICTVRKALGLLFKDVARVILPETYECLDFRSWSELSVSALDDHVRTVSLRIRIPEVIRLIACDHTARPKVVFSRRNLFRRDRNTCQYCGRRYPSEQLSIDHVTPRAQGGKSSWGNCVVACLRCNVRKGNRRPEEAGMALRHRPTEPHWRPSFALPLVRRRESWEHFVSEAYWNIELEE
jgi:5-methylcytosine-specific restriction endonuclease McrA